MTEERYPQDPILIVDDDISILLSVDTTLRMAGWDNIVTCSDSRRVMGLLAERPFSIMLLDLNMPHVGGEDLLAIIKSTIDIPIIIVTGAVDVATAVRCIKAGAFDYVVKPVEEDHLVASVRRAITFQELKQENIALRQHILSDISGTLTNPKAFSDIITQNKKMILIFQYVESIAITSQPVLINGETGVGKELIARTIHKNSSVKGKFVPINAAGLDDNMFSDTLFGHVKGAFTGADHYRQGLIEQASDGTLFLDEIGDLSPASQIKLLRLLQEKEYMPLGSDTVKKSNARVLTATNHNLSELSDQGKFRKDLYYRLRTHRIHIPPLRERMDDIPLLADHFLAKAAQELDKKKPTPPKELFTLLNTYSFPGNIRELHSIIFDAVSRHKSGVLSLEVFKGHIIREQSSTSGSHTEASDDIKELITFSDHLPTIKQATQRLIDEALKRAGGNQSMAARMLGVSQQALNKRLKSTETNGNESGKA